MFHILKVMPAKILYATVNIVLFISVVWNKLRVTFTTSQCSLAYEFTQVDQNNGITLSTISPPSGAWTTDVKSTIIVGQANVRRVVHMTLCALKVLVLFQMHWPDPGF
jgi:hypothetical protein